MNDTQDTLPKQRSPVARVLMGILIFQLGLGGLLVIGDMQGLRLPSFGPDAPRLTEPVRPGDQRRTFRPDRDRPVVQPARDPGELPDRLVLSVSDGTTYRLEGGIRAGDAERLIGLLEAADPAPETLILQSPGGSVGDALTLGRHIRAQGIDTQMLAGEFCYSACPYLLAAGTKRDISNDASVGVHQHYFGENTFLPAAFAVEDIQRGQGEVMTYLDEMGIDPLVMQHALSTPPDEIYVLLPDELEKYNFLTENQ
ncbi:hypothetical protein [uncultured Tateyamaria sp.]|uniref:COG3904 family protein n=1 Tax=uncultured Tateyamaria sp. TaxID=455651 RepID=UPI002611833A|nr:hypothetical protein [uncultured Tateyamaria sp.]